MVGPMDYVEIAFPGNQFKGEILPELGRLVSSGTVRIVDLVFVMKDEAGEVTALELQDMPKGVSDVLTPIVGDISQGMLSDEDVAEAGYMLEPGSSAGLLVLEHLWAKDLKAAVVNAGGILVAEGRIHSENVQRVLDEIAAASTKGGQ